MPPALAGVVLGTGVLCVAPQQGSLQAEFEAQTYHLLTKEIKLLQTIDRLKVPRHTILCTVVRAGVPRPRSADPARGRSIRSRRRPSAPRSPPHACPRPSREKAVVCLRACVACARHPAAVRVGARVHATAAAGLRAQVVANKENRELRVNKTLELMSAPKLWEMSDGQVRVLTHAVPCLGASAMCAACRTAATHRWPRCTLRSRLVRRS